MSVADKPTDQTYNIEGFLDYYCITHAEEIKTQFLDAKKAREHRQDRRNKGLVAAASVLLSTAALSALLMIWRPDEVADDGAPGVARVVMAGPTADDTEDLVLEDPDEQAGVDNTTLGEVALANLSPATAAVDPKVAIIGRIFDDLVNLQEQLSPAAIEENDGVGASELPPPRRKSKKSTKKKGGKSGKHKKTEPQPKQDEQLQDQPVTEGNRMEQTVIIDDTGITYYSERAVHINYRSERHKQAVTSCIEQGEDVKICVERFRNPSDKNNPLRPSKPSVSEPELELSTSKLAV
jgi:hypothetical protein